MPEAISVQPGKTDNKARVLFAHESGKNSLSEVYRGSAITDVARDVNVEVAE